MYPRGTFRLVGPAPTLSDIDTTIVDITGAGKLMLIYNTDTSSTITPARITIDGGTAQLVGRYLALGGVMNLMVPFNSSLKVEGGSTALRAVYALN